MILIFLVAKNMKSFIKNKTDCTSKINGYNNKINLTIHNNIISLHFNYFLIYINYGDFL